MDLSAAQAVDYPTRDVLVVFDNSGDREFIGFGSAKANQFADCFISADDLPADTIKVSGNKLACAALLQSLDYLFFAVFAKATQENRASSTVHLDILSCWTLWQCSHGTATDWMDICIAYL